MKGFFAIVAAAAVALVAFGMGQTSVERLNDCPDGRCPRTVPFNATTAPVFEAPPAVGVGTLVVQADPAPVAPVVGAPVVAAPSTGVQITDEQQEALKNVFFQVATLLIGVFAGRGTTSPIVTKILATVLEYLKNRQPAEPKAASTRKRVSRRK
jgi:hypothetical protein